MLPLAWNFLVTYRTAPFPITTPNRPDLFWEGLLLLIAMSVTWVMLESQCFGKLQKYVENDYDDNKA
eukprot:544138-Amphidinium_carterae.1